MTLCYLCLRKIATMKIQMLVVADYGSIDGATGKLNLIGVFNRIYSHQFPARHQRLAVVAKLVADSPFETTEPRNFELVLRDADATDLFQASGMISIARDPLGNQLDANIILEINMLEFPHPGTYEFSVRIEGDTIGETTIELIQLPQVTG